MNDIIREYAEELLHQIETETGLNYSLCCNSSYYGLHAVPSEEVVEAMEHYEGDIKAAFSRHFEGISFYNGEAYFSIRPDDWSGLERKLKIQSILDEYSL